jgi:pyruvate/2-oxoglutarate/acetoin dehydrogenase E1 component
VVAHGIGVEPAERAIDDADLDADLIDLRTLQPLDSDAVLASVRKTGRCLFVESAVGGDRVTTALLREIWERAFEYLDAPLARAEVAGASDDSNSITKACGELLAY